MSADRLSLSLLAVLAFSLGTMLEPWFQTWQGNRASSANLLQVALGDSRRLLARQVYAKADAYFHKGYYPTIYDNQEGFEKSHIQESTGPAHHADAHEEADDFLGKPKDWMDAFSRHFFPSQHSHVGETAAAHTPGQPDQSANSGGSKGHSDDAPEDEAREILPWLRLSADLDPQRAETYVVASYWLCSKLNKATEAEQFLREGLQANPGDCEILFELGRIYFENRHDSTRARNVWELAAKNWREGEGRKPEPNVFVYARILNNLALLERQQKNNARAIEHYTALKAISPNQASIQGWIDYLKTNQPPAFPGDSPR